MSNYTLAPVGKGNGLNEIDFVLADGDSWSITADLPDDAHLFMRAMATLENPVRGDYFYCGTRLDFSDYRFLLPYKKKIGYISPDSALIGNRTIEDNLLLMKSYFENARGIDEETEALCRYFQIEDKLNLRPAQLDREDLRLAVIIRELLKHPEMLLLERPRDFLGPRKFALFSAVLKEKTRSGIPLVFLTSDEEFTRDFAGREAVISRGFLTCS
ncbi:MAG: hypothetical protein ACE14T_02485 [Syntrophales bacterium]